MKTVIIEGFQVETNVNEARQFKNSISDINNFCSLDEIELLNEISCFLEGNRILDFIEEVGINKTPVNDYFYENSMGYKNRNLEPWNYRSTKKYLTLNYTGSMGGDSWTAKITL